MNLQDRADAVRLERIGAGLRAGWEEGWPLWERLPRAKVVSSGCWARSKGLFGMSSAGP